MKEILIAGGAGFIGSHLCDYLLKKDMFIYCLDNLITGSYENITHLIKNKNFVFKQYDIINPFDKRMVDELSDLSCIFNLASPASPVDYQNYPEETALVNSVGTYNLLRIAVKNNAKFLMASTSETYGDPKEHPQKETYWGNVNSYGPRSCYDESKRFSESLTYVFVKKYNLNARIIRIFNTYGPRMQKDDGRVVSNFINQALEGNPITVYGKGEQTRSFCYISDLVDGIYKAMFEKGTRGEVINLGNPQEYTILDFAKKIIDLTSSKSNIVYKPLPKDDPTKRRPDVSKANKTLGWKPKVSIEEGLKKTIEYYRSIK